MSTIKTVAVLGAGAMGRGIAQIAAQGGFEVLLHDADEAVMKDAEKFIDKMINRAVEKGRMEQDEAEAALARLKTVESMDEFTDADLVIEAIVEDLDIKRKVFKKLEDIVGADCILASNTSSLSITAIAAACERPGRVAGYHFFNPVPLMKVVEVVAGAMTDASIGERLAETATAMGHRPVRAKDTPGFLVNHAGRGFSTEGLRIVSEGIAETWQVDDVMKGACSFRMGPFELFDLTGMDVSLHVMEGVYRQFYDDDRYRPAYLAKQQFDAGTYGRKTGRGFYVYEDGKKVEPERAAPPQPAHDTVWIAPGFDIVKPLVTELVQAAGLTLADGKAAPENTVIITAPLGADATTTAGRLGLDATRTVAVDPLYGLEDHRTVMTTPVTAPEIRDTAHALFAADGVPVSVIQDSPGFIAQRMIAMIVNIACEIAQQGIATPADIDAAVKLGLGYPKGPLEFGDDAGAHKILTVLEELHGFYGDPRYRPSPWLKRRAMLDVPLATIKD